MISQIFPVGWSNCQEPQRQDQQKKRDIFETLKKHIPGKQLELFAREKDKMKII